MTYFLSMEGNQFDHAIFISQQAFALKILNNFCMSNCKIVSTPVAQGEKLTNNSNHERVDEKEYRSLVGCLLYLTATRPDIRFAATKRFFRFVKGTLDYGMKFEKAKELMLLGYSDSDWARSIEDMKSTSIYFFTLGSGVFCWISKKQQIVTQSTSEAEYIAAAIAINQAIWLRKLLCDLNEDRVEATEIRVDNQLAVATAKKSSISWKNQTF
ncbi:secreted RxLR effector protein 161-like [Gossypium hirsutum]|uniref:Secreted RxLR effector protein 161-like n=1 Tax=Gossypium hirsutum TaxID=3635 RepID=A0A1U8PFH9_GOSHI|nr:secreted RxLR effector protein 161-like [Gossypium hirsutum]